MSYEQRKNEGALFPNDKEGNDKRPDHKGILDIDGVAWEVAAWEKVSKGGKRYLSLKAEPSKRKDVSSSVPDSRPATQGRPTSQSAPRTQQARPQGRNRSELSYEDGKALDDRSGMTGWDEDLPPPF